MHEELYSILWNHHLGCIDLRRRSPVSILRERLRSAGIRMEYAERSYELASDEREKMAAFIKRFHLDKLYEDHLRDIREGVYKLFPEVDCDLPFDLLSDINAESGSQKEGM